MTIHFYLDDENETPVTSFYDIQSNPFTLGDALHLDVEELFPIDYHRYREDYQIKLRTDNEELEKKFKRKTVKLIKEYKSVRFHVIKGGDLTIEYHCQFVED